METATAATAEVGSKLTRFKHPLIDASMSVFEATLSIGCRFFYSD
jgi:hypothetical protein